MPLDEEQMKEAREAIEKEKKDKGIVEVPQDTLTKILEKQSEQERLLEESRAKTAGIEEMLAKGAAPEGEPKLRKKNDFEPKFRTVRIRKYPMKGDIENLGYIVGWTSRGAYRKVDTSGLQKEWVDMLDVIFLGHERNAEGKLQAESIPLLDIMNNGVQVNCKILKVHREEKDKPTGEQIAVQTFDPKHGLVPTGEIIDGFTSYSEIKYEVQIPGIAEPVTIDSLYCN